jgi:hypothetical protein
MSLVDENNNTPAYAKPREHLPMLIALKGADLGACGLDYASLADALASEAMNGPLVEETDECKELLWVASVIRMEDDPEARLAYLADALEIISKACAGRCTQRRRENGSAIFDRDVTFSAIELAEHAMVLMRGICAQIARDQVELNGGAK